ncbi:MAG TPA: ferrochelatase, partial [Candidatus Limnocylindrales bacterium]|nr:ferrochelatase [Candidatus Limnocylindrales bacterium]
MTCGALLMTYGSPASLDRQDIAAYLARVRGGHEPDDALVDEFTRRYNVIGGSPLIDITRQQASALSRELGWPVEVGMRFSDPSIARGLRTLADVGVTKVAALIMSPQYSPILMGGYARSIDAARASIGSTAPEVMVVGPWHHEPAFIDAIAGRVRMALGPDRVGRLASHVLMTAHSLPKRVAEQEPGYLDQLRATAEAIARKADLAPTGWTFCWQSAG